MGQFPMNIYCVSFHNGRRHISTEKRQHSVLRLYCLNGVQVIKVVLIVNWYVFHANLSHGKVDEDLWRCSNNVRGAAVSKAIIPH